MKDRIRNRAAHWSIPVLALLATIVPVRALGARSAEPADTGETVIVSSFGRAEGTVGDLMKTSFMEFKINSAATADQYQTLLPDEGMKLLVLNITTHVTQKNPLVLYDTDYQIQWGGEGELDYSEPVSYRDEWADFTGYKRQVDPESLEGIFPGSGVLASDETVTYDYVYQVPAEAMNFRLLFQEYFEDERIGDLFLVTVPAESAGVISGNLGEIKPLSGTAEIVSQDAETPADGETAQAG